jgi:hypothetical protein
LELKTTKVSLFCCSAGLSFSAGVLELPDSLPTPAVLPVFPEIPASKVGAGDCDDVVGESSPLLHEKNRIITIGRIK